MNAGLIAIVAIVVLVGGVFLGVTSLLLLPLVGALAAVALVIWMLRRRAEHKPPIE